MNPNKNCMFDRSKLTDATFDIRAFYVNQMRSFYDLISYGKSKTEQELCKLYNTTQSSCYEIDFTDMDVTDERKDIYANEKLPILESYARGKESTAEISFPSVILPLIRKIIDEFYEKDLVFDTNYNEYAFQDDTVYLERESVVRYVPMIIFYSTHPESELETYDGVFSCFLNCGDVINPPDQLSFWSIVSKMTPLIREDSKTYEEFSNREMRFLYDLLAYSYGRDLYANQNYSEADTLLCDYEVPEFSLATYNGMIYPADDSRYYRT